MPGRTVIVTDSTAMIPPDLAAERGIVVVPLQVIIGSEVFDEGEERATPTRVAQALREFLPVSTSRPAPAALQAAYDAAAADGATHVVSVHLSGEMSGTFESAQLAARARAAASSSFFYVDTLEYLRRGGRIGAASALFGGALAVKPLLTITDGRVGTLEKVRTSTRALGRLEDLAVEAAGDGPVDVCVSHLASPDRAGVLAEHLATRLAGQLDGREVWCGELGAVLGAHVGPGMVAVCVAPLLPG